MPEDTGTNSRDEAAKPESASSEPTKASGPARRKRAPRVFKKSLDKRQTILASAAKVFKDKGYSEASLSVIAKEAGTFAGALYYYFESKNHLVDEVLSYSVAGVDELVALIKSFSQEVPYRERIRAALTFHLTQAMQRDDFILAYWRIIDQIPAELRERHLSKPYAYNELWEDLIKGAIDAGEIRPGTPPSVVRMLLLGATVTGIDWFHLGIDWFHLGLNEAAEPRFHSPQQLADQMVAIVFDGVAGPD